MTTTTNIFSGEVKLNNNLVIKEYRLMYFFGCWLTAKKIYAENDAEAIFDAKHEMADAKGKTLRYALFCGNRKVTELQKPSFNDGIN